MSITVQIEPYRDCIDEMRGMYQAHFNELYASSGIKLNPNYPLYDGMDSAGILHVVAVRYSGRLVGYMMFVVAADLHTSEIVATEDIYYLMPEYRGAFLGVSMFRVFEAEAARLGAVRLVSATQISKDNTALLERCGFELKEKMFMKELRHG